MPQPDRKPITKMESRDERITVRFTSTEVGTLRDGALRRGEEISRYIRRVALMGHSISQSIPA